MQNNTKIYPDLLDLTDELLNSNQFVKVKLGGYSMYPFIKAGDIALIKKCKLDELNIGDIIVFKLNNKWIAHRLIKVISENGDKILITKGDSELKNDKPITEKEFTGKIVSITHKNREIDLENHKYQLKSKRIIRFNKALLPFIGLWLFVIIMYKKIATTTLEIIRDFKFICKESKKIVLQNVLISILQGILPFAVIYMIKEIIDSLTSINQFSDSETVFSSILLLIVITGILFFLQSSISVFSSQRKEKLSQSITSYIYKLLHKKHSSIDIERLEDSNQQDKIYRGVQEAGFRPLKMINESLSLVQSTISWVIIFVMLLGVHWSVFLLILIAAFPEFITRIYYAKKLYVLTKKNSQKEREMFYYNHILTGKAFAKELRLFNLEHFFTNRFGKLQNQLFDEKNRVINKRTLANIIVQIFTTSVTFLSFAMVAYLAINKQISIGTVVLFFLVFQRGFAVMKDLFQSLAGLIEDHIFIKDFISLINLPNLYTKNQTNKKLTEIEKGIYVNNVSFQYPSSQRKSLNNITLEIPKGKITAIVGANGSGKTTLIKLLCGFYQPTKGNIKFDDKDISNYKDDEIRNQITAVFQDFALYNIAAKENIALGDCKKEYTLQEIKQAAQSAGIDDIIENLPNSYDTILGNLFEKGEDLSIGQWQKIAIAKAFFRNTPVVLMDEPSSALDTETEQQLLEKLKSLAKNKAVLLVSHRLTSINWVDNIIVFDEGKIIENGNYEQLLAKKGKFFEMMQDRSKK